MVQREGGFNGHKLAGDTETQTLQRWMDVKINPASPLYCVPTTSPPTLTTIQPMNTVRACIRRSSRVDELVDIARFWFFNFVLQNVTCKLQENEGTDDSALASGRDFRFHGADYEHDCLLQSCRFYRLLRGIPASIIRVMNYLTQRTAVSTEATFLCLGL